jgi:hypothetical protein
MKHLLLKHLLLFIVFSPSTVGIASGQEEEALKQDLQRYLEEAQGWASTEARINGPIDNVQSSHFVNDQFVISTLSPVVSLVQDYVGRLENYQPQTPTLQTVHQHYVGAWRFHHLACTTIVEAMEKKDYILLAQGTKGLREARSTLLDVLDGLSQLLVESGLRPEEQSPGPATAPRGSPFP